MSDRNGVANGRSSPSERSQGDHFFWIDALKLVSTGKNFVLYILLTKIISQYQLQTMPTRANNEPDNSPSKRVRFVQKTDKHTTPSTAAKAKFDFQLPSLPDEMTPVFRQQFQRLLSKYKEGKELEATILKLQDPDFIPRSLDIKFEIGAPDDFKEASSAFIKERQDICDAAKREYQAKTKKALLEVNQERLKYTEQNRCDLLCQTAHQVIASQRELHGWDNPTCYAVAAELQNYHADLFRHYHKYAAMPFAFHVELLRECGYEPTDPAPPADNPTQPAPGAAPPTATPVPPTATLPQVTVTPTHGAAVPPTPTAPALFAAAAPTAAAAPAPATPTAAAPTTTAAAPTEATQQDLQRKTCLVKEMLMKIAVHPFDDYVRVEQRNAASLRVTTLARSFQTVNITEATAMEIDGIDSNSPQIAELLRQVQERNRKETSKAISKLESKFFNTQKNSPKGRKGTRSPATKKKGATKKGNQQKGEKESQGQAGESNNGSNNDSANNGKRPSTKSAGKKRKTTRGKRNKPSQR